MTVGPSALRSGGRTDRARRILAIHRARLRASRRRGPLRRAHPSGRRHRRHGRRPDELLRDARAGTASPARSRSVSTSPTASPRSAPPNDRTLATRGGRRPDRPLRPARSRDGPLDEAVRCLDLGARGIKLHPRAQKFSVGDERLGADLRPRPGAQRPDPDPRRAWPAADRRRARRLVERYAGVR